jgi:hypothetical protein
MASKVNIRNTVLYFLTKALISEPLKISRQGDESPAEEDG